MDLKIGEEAILLGTIAQALPDPIFIIDEYGVYVEVIGGAVRNLYDSGDFLRKKTLHDVFPKDIADRFHETVKKTIETGSLQVIEYQLASGDMNFNPMDGPKEAQWYEGRVFPFNLFSEKKTVVLWIAINITEKKKAWQERDTALEKLTLALKEIKTLQGFLPLCSNCKQVLNGKGHWQEVDEYIQDHTSVSLSHTVCPECRKKLYPDLF